MENNNDKEYFVIDRIESSRVVLQSLFTGEVFVVEKDIFVDKPKEGDTMFLENGLFVTDDNYTLERKKSLHEDMHRLFNRRKN